MGLGIIGHTALDCRLFQAAVEITFMFMVDM
jgi:hypothetical protein